MSRANEPDILLCAGLFAHSQRAVGAAESTSLPRYTTGGYDIEEGRCYGDAATAWGLFGSHNRTSNSDLTKITEEDRFVAGTSTRCW